MTNFKNNRRGQKTSTPTLGDHMGRLPLQQQLNCSQRMLVKLSPSWHRWLNDNLNDELTNSAALSHYADGQLLISCNNAVIASQIKHLQNSLISFLNHNGFKEINTISTRIEHPAVTKPEKSNERNPDTIDQATSYCQPSSNSIKSINHCHQSISSESLTAALQRLEKTLKNY